MNWHFDISFSSRTGYPAPPSTFEGHLVDLDGTDPPRHLTGTEAEIVRQVHDIVGENAAVQMDLSGIAYGTSIELVRANVWVLGYHPIRRQPLRDIT